MSRLFNLSRTGMVIGSSVLFCILLSVTRVIWTGKITYLFLVWNLFLAYIPWLISSLMTYRKRISGRVSARSFLILSPLWLLFFPNSGYIITDLLHLRTIASPALWFDVLLLTSYAWTGLYIGLMSLHQMEGLLRQWISSMKSFWLSSFILFLSAFGIYLGRFLRWNSWDIIHEPFGLLKDILHILSAPHQNLTAWGITLIMGLMLNLIYWALKGIPLKGERVNPDRETF